MKGIWDMVRIDSLKLLILFTYFSVIVSQGLRNACQHNQFRCSDNGRCLSTEALCNGRRDCPNGEDERGDRVRGTWSCRSITLGSSSTTCDSAQQFRCRFGGCILRTNLCDGRVDCYGGGDEAWDICQQGNKIQIPTGVGSVQQSPQTTPRQNLFQQTTTTQRPYFTTPSIVTDTRNQFPSSSGGRGGTCGGITEDPSKGFNIICENSRLHEVPCDGATSGTTAQYTCENRYFSPTSSLVLTTGRRCEGGRWSPLNPKFGCEARCGVSASDQGAFIVGGLTAKSGKWPWVVAIYERNSRNPNKMDLICGASLISSKAVITAAHCVVRRDNRQVKPSGDLAIVFGKYYRTYDRKSTGEQERGVGQVFVHQDYNPVTLRSDIAIIKLSEPVKISETVRPVCLPQARDETEPGKFGTLVGWGRGAGKTFSEQLQQAELPVVSSQQCIDAHPQFAHLVHPGTFCAGYRNGTSACDGDSGGPLVFRDRYSPSKWILHGVVSAGIASSERAGCNPNYYTVFTDVSHYTIRRWISYILDSNFNF